MRGRFIGATAAISLLMAALVLPSAHAEPRRPPPVGFGADVTVPTTSRVRPAVKVSKPSLTPRRVIVREKVVVRGKARPSGRRQATLQRRTKSGWRNIARDRTKASGKYRFEVRTRWAPAKIRVVARGARGKVRSPVRKVRTKSQQVSLAVPASITVDVATTLTATSRPARRGRSVVLERRVNGSWARLDLDKADRHGRAVFTATLPQVGTAVLRARALKYNGAPSAVSKDYSVPVVAQEPFAVTVAGPTAYSRVKGDLEVTAWVTSPDGAPPADVRVYAAGEFVGSATAKPDGSWRAVIDSRRIANGDSDITVQARGGSRRGLSPSVPIRLDNGALPSTISGLPEGFRIESMSGGYYYGTNFAVIDSHRVLVTEKSGLVFLVVDGVYHRSQPLLNISSMVEDAWDLGLVGLALDPDFATNGWFYLAYTGVETASGLPTPIAQTRMQHVVRYTLSGGAVNPSSRHEILGQVNPTTCWGSEAQWLTNGCLPIRGGTHSVDDLAFDAGGNLLISVGDGLFTVPDRALLIKAQDPDYLMGKILRVNKVTGQGLPDNPFWTGNANDNASRVWAVGFRNPFRMTRRSNGELYVSDVGEDDFEELNRVVKGGNFGWPCYEGNSPGIGATVNPYCPIVNPPAPGLQAPLYSYAHAPGGAAVAGVFYDGTDYPAAYRGKYFFGDYSVGKLFTLDVANPAATVATFAESPTGGGPVKFAIGPDGNVWYLSITSSDLRRIVYDPTGSQCPSDQFTGEWWASSTIPAGTPPDIVTCDPTLPDGGWNGTSNGLRPPNGLDASGGFSVRWVGRPLTDTGTYSVTKQATQPMVVKVDDQVISGNQFRVDSATATQATPKIEVSVSSSSPVDSAYRLSWVRQGSGPTVKLSGITQGVRVANGTKLGWTVTATDAQDGSLTGAAVRTEVVLLHFNGEDAHQHTDASMGGTTGSFDFGDTHSPGVAVYRVVARATDSSGWSEQSAPVYVCLDGNLVGVCS